MKAIAYYRVSTEQQGKSGLSLEAQRKAIGDFARTNNYVLIEEYIEIRSGRCNMHYALKAALAECKISGAVLLIAKLDRLSRNVAFIAALMEAKNVKFTVVDNPQADEVMLHLYAVFAEYERKLNSKRTSAALQAAKLRGIVLGKHGREVLSKVNRFNADMFAQKMKPIIDGLKSKGILTIRAIVTELNRLKVPTYSKRSWHVTSVHKLLRRIYDIENT